VASNRHFLCLLHRAIHHASLGMIFQAVVSIYRHFGLAFHDFVSLTLILKHRWCYTYVDGYHGLEAHSFALSGFIELLRIHQLRHGINEVSCWLGDVSCCSFDLALTHCMHINYECTMVMFYHLLVTLRSVKFFNVKRKLARWPSQMRGQHLYYIW
jgi:hypothetical protein